MMQHVRSLRPSPALAFIGRKNSGKTTLLEKLIAELTARNVEVATLKHHGHPHFEIDVPGKDSYRHKQAGAKATAIVSPDRFAFIQEVDELAHPLTSKDALLYLNGYDIVLVEGFRNEGIPSIEIMRQENERDVAYVQTFAHLLNTEPTNSTRRPVAAVSDIETVHNICKQHNIPCFSLNNVASLADFVCGKYVRAQLSIAIQAGGESKRMGQSKALVPFRGAPLIQHIVEQLSPIADDLLITTNEPEQLAFLSDIHPCIRLVRDDTKTRGALPGLLTALRHTHLEHVAVIACDMVCVSPQLISAEFALLQDIHTEAVVPRTKHGLEPLSGVYCTAPFLDAAEKTYAQGESRLREVLAKLNLIELERTNPYGIHFPMGCFMNVNTPDELRFAEKFFE